MRRILIALTLGLTLFAGVPALPVASALPAVTQRVGDPNVKVWVNTNSGVYHCPGTRWYGNTKQGQYMTQKQAQSAGHRPAHGSVCG